MSLHSTLFWQLPIIEHKIDRSLGNVHSTSHILIGLINVRSDYLKFLKIRSLNNVHFLNFRLSVYRPISANVARNQRLRVRSERRKYVNHVTDTAQSPPTHCRWPLASGVTSHLRHCVRWRNSVTGCGCRPLSVVTSRRRSSRQWAWPRRDTGAIWWTWAVLRTTNHGLTQLTGAVY